MMPEDLLDLFFIFHDDIPKTYYRLKGTNYLYIGRPKYKWVDVRANRSPSFEEVLDNVPEDTQTRFLFHLDFFLGEVIDG